jgi:hypothetical protein
MLTATERNETNWIQTASGIKFYPLAPHPEDVTIEDIAHALSKMCRFNGHNGHTSAFYSVAQHCGGAARGQTPFLRPGSDPVSPSPPRSAARCPPSPLAGEGGGEGRP